MVTLIVAVLGIAPLAHAAPDRTSQTTAAERAAAVRIALTKVRAPYAHGAMGPRRFDCSGLVNFAFREAGHALPARSSFDLFDHGAIVSRRALRPGDLVWTWDRSYGHVGIYVGRGRYVHAPGEGRRVEVAALPTGRDFVGAVRP